MSLHRALTFIVVSASSLTLGAPHTAAQQAQGITVVVENHSFFDMHVYAVQSGQRRSLGLATGLSKRTFQLPRTLAESDRKIQILADPIGSRGGYVTELLFLDPGEQVNLILENNLNLSWILITDQRPPNEMVKPPQGEAEGPRSGGPGNRT